MCVHVYATVLIIKFVPFGVILITGEQQRCSVSEEPPVDVQLHVPEGGEGSRQPQ